MSATHPNRADTDDELLTITFKVGRWVRYRRGDVRAWINAKRLGTAAS